MCDCAAVPCVKGFVRFRRNLRNSDVAPMGFARHGVQNPALFGACREICAFQKRKWLPFGETRIIRGDKNHGKEAAMNDSTSAHRLRGQLKKFVGIVFPHAPKPQKEFLGQMFFGIQAGQTTVLSRIARELEEGILLKKTEERLSRHLLDEGLDAMVQDAVLAQGAACVHDDTIVSIDPSDIQKPYAQEGGMPLLAKVWDGSKGRVGDNLGYNLCFAAASPSMSRRIVPLHMTMWSTKEDGFTSENDKVLEVVRKVAGACEGRGIYVYDRGGDGDWLFDFFVKEGLDFIVRLVGDRHLLHWNGRRLAADLAGTCVMKYRQRVTFKSHGKERDVPIEYGSIPVRLPEHPDVELRLVVVQWPKCETPMMLLTTLRAARSRKSLRQVVEGYLTRWRVEETIRFVKQAYEIEDVRLLKFDRLKAMVAIVLATAYFAMAWLGLSDKLAVLADHVKRVSKRMFDVPDFFFYAIADGLRTLFSRHGRWNGLDDPDKEPEEPCQMILAL